MKDETLQFLQVATSFLDLASKSQREFVSEIHLAIRRLWNGTYTVIDFVAMVAASIEDFYREAWIGGARACGVREGEFTEDDENELEGEIESDRDYIGELAAWVEEHSRANGGSLATVLTRAELWDSRYQKVKSHARSWFCADQKLRWVMNPLKEHCEDCLNLDGRVYRASTWEAYDIRPGSHDLQCGGFRCGCSFQITDAAVTPGRPPELIGPG